MWEASEQYNGGIDFAAFNNRLEITLDVYRKQTDGLLMQVFTPDTSPLTTGVLSRHPMPISVRHAIPVSTSRSTPVL